MKSEIKYCARCSEPFIGNNDANIDCSGAQKKLSSAEINIVNNVYKNCLCKKCWAAIGGKFKNFKMNTKKAFIQSLYDNDESIRN